MLIEWWHALLAASMLIGAGIWIGKVDADRRNFREFMEEIRKDIKEIFTRLPAKPLSETSPLTLTDKGRKMLAEINGVAWAQTASSAVIEKVRGMDEYQIQEFCFKYVREINLTDEQEASIRKCAYENASNKEETLDVLAIEIRDHLLQQLGRQT